MLEEKEDGGNYKNRLRRLKMMYIYSIYDSSSGESFFPEFAPDDTTYIERIKYRIKNHSVWKTLYTENQKKSGKYVLRINGVFVQSTGMVYNENPDNGIAYPKVLAKFSDLF
jgi:hypothetical protein